MKELTDYLTEHLETVKDADSKKEKDDIDKSLNKMYYLGFADCINLIPRIEQIIKLEKLKNEFAIK